MDRTSRYARCEAPTRSCTLSTTAANGHSQRNKETGEPDDATSILSGSAGGWEKRPKGPRSQPTQLQSSRSTFSCSNSRCSPKNSLPPDHACKVVICWPPLPKRRAPDCAGSPRRTTGGHCHVACARRTSPPQRLVSASFSMARRTVPTEGIRRNLQRTLGRFS